VYLTFAPVSDAVSRRLLPAAAGFPRRTAV
jgi:hypothetical protein